MNFAARQRELMECLHWAPSRGPKRQALLAQLRLLVRDELQREVAAGASSAQLAAPPPQLRLEPPTQPSLYAHEPYWIDL